VRRERERAEAATILAALERCQWNRKKAALLLAIDYKRLLYRIRKLGLNGNGRPRSSGKV